MLKSLVGVIGLGTKFPREVEDYILVEGIEPMENPMKRVLNGKRPGQLRNREILRSSRA